MTIRDFCRYLDHATRYDDVATVTHASRHGRSRIYHGHLIGDDTCIDGDRLYQYLVTPDGRLLRCWYAIDGSTCLDDLDYSTPDAVQLAITAPAAIAAADDRDGVDSMVDRWLTL